LALGLVVEGPGSGVVDGGGLEGAMEKVGKGVGIARGLVGIL